MSRIGKRPIDLPDKTEVSISGPTVTVTGSLGSLSRIFKSEIEIKVTGNQVLLEPKKGSTEEKALWGTYASHLSNMVKGVNTPFEKQLILEGIGFKSDVKGSEVILALGFSHPVKVIIPEGLTVKAEKNVITISGSDKELVGGFAARLRSLKKAEPYKGKGMRYSDEVIRRKQGKKTA